MTIHIHNCPACKGQYERSYSYTGELIYETHCRCRKKGLAIEFIVLCGFLISMMVLLGR